MLFSPGLVRRFEWGVKKSVRSLVSVIVELNRSRYHIISYRNRKGVDIKVCFGNLITSVTLRRLLRQRDKGIK